MAAAYNPYVPIRDVKLKAVIYGSYFIDELLPNLDEQAKMKSDIVPEWHPEVKYAKLLRLDQRFEMVDILHSDTYEGKIHDWCMGYIRARQPDIVLLNFGEPELCNLGYSTFHIASKYIEVARTLISEEYKVGHVMCVGAIPLSFGIPCTPSRFRKRVYGLNTKMETMTQPRLGFKFLPILGQKLKTQSRLCHGFHLHIKAIYSLPESTRGTWNAKGQRNSTHTHNVANLIFLRNQHTSHFNISRRNVKRGLTQVAQLRLAKIQKHNIWLPGPNVPHTPVMNLALIRVRMQNVNQLKAFIQSKQLSVLDSRVPLRHDVRFHLGLLVEIR